MDLSKLTYSKRDSELEIGEASPKTAIKIYNRNRSTDFQNIAFSYQKQDGVISASLVFVISGGEKREKDFLKTLMSDRKFSVRVVFLDENIKCQKGLNPSQMQDEWIRIKATGEFVIDGKYFHIEDMDKVFLLSDVDDFYDRLLKIFADYPEDKDKWLISNPCFEMWLYYCYKNSPCDDLCCIDKLEPNKRSSKLKTLCNKVITGGANPVYAFMYMNTGIGNSQSHYAEDENGIPVLYATKVYELAKYLVDTMNKNNEEYDRFMKEKEEKEKEWKNRIIK